jgi:serine kinase of HPr protein (carbohydrate metabolism regulator)
MTVRDLVEQLGLEVIVGADLDREISGGSVSDLLSHVMASGREGNVWVTLQSHQNIIAVSSLLNFAAIIIACGVKAEPNTVEKAQKEGVNLLATDDEIYAVAGKMYSLKV